MRFILLSIFVSLNLLIMAQDKPTLIYIGDPMCSWCYGFSPEFSKTVEKLDDKVELELVMGGLRPYNKQTMKDLGDFLHHHWEEVNKRSGQPFKYGILNDQSFVYDTEPACRAVRVIRDLAPTQELAFFQKIQSAFYHQNKNTAAIETYLNICEDLKIDKSAFKTAFESDAMKTAIREDFKASAEMGVRGFPTVILKKDGKFIRIANGYNTAENVVNQVNLFLE